MGGLRWRARPGLEAEALENVYQVDPYCALGDRRRDRDLLVAPALGHLLEDFPLREVSQSAALAASTNLRSPSETLRMPIFTHATSALTRRVAASPSLYGALRGVVQGDAATLARREGLVATPPEDHR